MRIHGTLVLIASVLSACAQVYVPPEPQARAQLRISSSIQVLQYMDNGDDCSGARRFNDADNPFRRADRILEAPAGRRIAVNLIVNGPGASSCNVTMSFVLQPGRRYEAQMTSLVDRCIARIVEPGQDPSATASAIGLKQVRTGLSGSCAGQ
jgi:hypothetical protein